MDVYAKRWRTFGAAPHGQLELPRAAADMERLHAFGMFQTSCSVSLSLAAFVTC
jgi:hypothetical protein